MYTVFSVSCKDWLTMLCFLGKPQFHDIKVASVNVTNFLI